MVDEKTSPYPHHTAMHLVSCRQDIPTCESLRGFQIVLGTTWASWSRDTCESLSGFYFVLGTSWASWSRDACESLNDFYIFLGTEWAFYGGCKQLVLVFRVSGEVSYSRGPHPVCLVFMLSIGVCRIGVSVIMFFICFAHLFRGRFVLGSLMRIATDPDP